MKKFFKQMVSVLIALIASIGMTACKIERPGPESINESKTQIYVALYNGGLGNQWLHKVKESFEAKYPEYQVVIDPAKANFDAGNIYNNFSSYEADIFILDYVENVHYNSWINAGYAADITDVVYTEKLSEYGENLSIYDKMNDSLKNYFYNDGKVYAVPWYQASYQTIYDKALFREYELYKDANGEWNDGTDKHFGIDGVASYDDGLPRTISEFMELIEYMKSNDCGVTPYTFYGNADFYVSSYLSSVFADYEGKNDFMLNLTLNGTDSDLGEITLENGYLLKNGQKGKRFALELAQYIASDSKNYSGYAFATSQDDVTAQREYLLSAETNNRIAMLIEGPWWETASKQVFTDMANKFKDDTYSFGNREFGVMPIPQADDGTSSDERVICCNSGRSMILVNGKRNSETISNAKKFLKYMHSNEALNIEIAYSNVARPYTVDMKAEYLSLMTPYARELQEVYNSSTVVYENIANCDFLRYEGQSFCGYLTLFKADSMSLAILKNFIPGSSNTVDDYLACMANDETLYKSVLNEYKQRVGQ